jgi:NAD(P)-dependent dehydrogenase (short-subunit alcohol dehydrogenase family)
VAIFDNAFVTGASSGLGRAICLELGRRGTRVVLAARRRGELEKVAREVAAAGGRADIAVVDVSDTYAARDAVRHWDRETGGLDLVLADAGTDQRMKPREMEWEHVERVLQVNAMGALATVVSAVKPMLERGRGTIGAVTSLAAMRGLPGHGAYSASKAAVSTFLEALGAEVRRYGLRVVDIRPGFVETPLTAKNQFEMPFMMDVTKAARISVRALEKGTPIVTYPWQLARAMSVAEVMPDVLWRAVAPRLPR